MINLRSRGSLMNEIYTRVIQNKPFDRNLNLYKKELITEVLVYFEEKEEYEKCKELSDFIKKRFSHK